MQHQILTEILSEILSEILPEILPEILSEILPEILSEILPEAREFSPVYCQTIGRNIISGVFIYFMFSAPARSAESVSFHKLQRNPAEQSRKTILPPDSFNIQKNKYSIIKLKFRGPPSGSPLLVGGPLGLFTSSTEAV